MYVFIGPPADSISPDICIIANLLTEGRRLLLAPMYLGGLYARLDQIQEQMKISFGHFAVNYFVDKVFLQYFLFERFLPFGPI